MVEVFIEKPNNISKDHFDKIVDLVISGGEVSEAFIQIGLMRAKLISYVMVDGEIVSTASIKVPNDSYKKRVFDFAGISDDIDYEFGYNVTRVDMRRKGYATMLMKKLFSKITIPLFATVNLNNYMSIELLERNGFVKVGKPFSSSRGNHQIQTMVRK
jgi:RimJ/RimL family protein N-acetyltransferase